MRIITTNSGRITEYLSSGSAFNKKEEPEEERRAQGLQERYPRAPRIWGGYD